MNTSSNPLANDAPGFKFIGLTSDQLWGKWIEDTGEDWSQERRSQWQNERRILKQQREEEERQRRSLAMGAADRDRYYRDLLSRLILHPEDRADLYRRGLTDEQIERWGVKSVGRWQALDPELPYTLPGVSLDGRSLNTQPGYLCPVHDVDGCVVAFQMRLREGEQGGRYRWLTSATKKRPDGPTPHLPSGELPLAVHRPVEVTQPGILMIEGTGAKPFIACDRLGMLTVGAAGGQFANSPATLRNTLEKLTTESGDRHVVDPVDAGAINNPATLRQLQSKWQLLRRWRFSVSVLWWDQLGKSSLDLDELPSLDGVQLTDTLQIEATMRRNEVMQQMASVRRSPRVKTAAPSLA